MKSIAPLSFSQVIAYLLPGFVALYSLIYVSPRVAELMTSCLAKDAGVGPWFGVVLFSLIAGVSVSAFRGLVVDGVASWWTPPRTELDYSKLTNEHTLNAYIAAVDNTYRFAQHCGNMFVAMVMLLILRCWADDNWLEHWRTHGSIATLAVVLFLAFRTQLAGSRKVIRKILS